MDKSRALGWHLPPGVTDKDIDDAAPQEDWDQCDVCGEWWRAEDIEFIPAHALSCGCDTYACPKCRGET